MKIFNVSLHRSGGQSFHRFCRDNDLRSLHYVGNTFDAGCFDVLQHLDTQELWRAYRNLCVHSEACSDLPCPMIYEEAHHDFPEARFVLIIRQPTRWIASVRKHTAGRALTILERFMYWSVCVDRHERLSEYSDQELEVAYMKHISNVVRFMHDNHAGFVLVQLEDTELSERLAHFLGLTKTSEFPHIDRAPFW